MPMMSSNFGAGIVGPIGVRGPARWERPMGMRPPIPRVMRRGYDAGGPVSPLSAYAAQADGPTVGAPASVTPNINMQLAQRAMMDRPRALDNVMNLIRQAGPTTTYNPNARLSLMMQLMKSPVNRPSIAPVQSGALGMAAGGDVRGAMRQTYQDPETVEHNSDAGHGFNELVPTRPHLRPDGMLHYDDGGWFSGIGDAISGAGSWLQNLFTPSGSSSGSGGADPLATTSDLYGLNPSQFNSAMEGTPASPSYSYKPPSVTDTGGSGGSSGTGGKNTLASLMPLLMAALVLPGMFGNKKVSSNPAVLRNQVTSGNFKQPLANNSFIRQPVTPSTDFFTYGQRPEQIFFGGNQLPTGKKRGGDIHGGREMAAPVGALGAAAGQGHVQGPGGGQADEVPAMLSDGEWVGDSTFVSDLGDGSNRAGAQKLDQFRDMVARDKGRKTKLAPKSRPIEHYAKRLGVGR